MARAIRRRQRSRERASLPIPAKANLILNLFLLLFVGLGIRVLQLCIIKHDQIAKEVLHPRQKIFIEPAKRGGIYDRFGKPLAVNKVQYNIGVFYAPIRQIPSIRWKKKGRIKEKTYPRREYIQKLAHLLGRELGQDPARIEDLIHAKASILFDSPYILLEDVSEKDYYRIKMLENHWPGIYAGQSATRTYPAGRVAGHLLGYMGSISGPEYDSRVRERRALRSFLQEWEMGYFPTLPRGFSSVSEARARLKELTERSYSIYDWVGKSGLEAKFDEELRGFFGKQVFYADAKGNFLRPLATSQESLSGKKLSLTISLELQEYAEKLLIDNERIREGRSIRIDPTNGSYVYQKQPWIKGGSIVVMDPNTGDILAMASYPRYDPNDFILMGNREAKEKKTKQICRWLENERYIRNIWNHQQSLCREKLNRKTHEVEEEQYKLTWERYLSLVLPKDSNVADKLLQCSLKEAIELQRAFEWVLSLSSQESATHLLKVLYPNGEPYPKGSLPRKVKQKIVEALKENYDLVASYKRVLDKHYKELEKNYDKLLLTDLCRLAVDARRVPGELLDFLETIRISTHREHEGCYQTISNVAEKMTKDLFHELHFTHWRKEHQKAFLKVKRAEEKEQGIYPHPYLDYLDAEEREQFKSFWQENKEAFLATFLSGEIKEETSSDLAPYFDHFSLWAKEIRQGAHKALAWREDYLTLSKLFKTWPKDMASFYLRTLRGYEELDRTLYATYRGVYPTRRAQEKHLARSFYPRHGYSYARSYAFSQATPQGSLFKLVTAYEALRQKTSKYGLQDVANLNPLTIVDDLHKASGEGWNIGFTTSGKAIPQMYKGGRLPRSHRRGIGKLDLKRAIAMTSNPYFSLLAADIIENPSDLNRAAADFSFGSKTGLDIPGEISGQLPRDLDYNPTGLYSYAIGHHTLVVTPLQSAVMLSAIANGGYVLKPRVVRAIEGISLAREAELSQRDFVFKKYLANLGIDFPLYLAKERREKKEEERVATKVTRQIELPLNVQTFLFQAMRQVVESPEATACPDRVRSFSAYHPVYQSYQNLRHQIIGKTSSAEVREVIDLDLYKGVNTYKHVWFGGIVFEEDVTENQWKKPELVVVVYLRYGDFGREAAPLVAALAEKWRKIKKKEEVERER